MDRALEAFEQGERARIAGDDKTAIDHYREALTLCEDSGQLEAWRVHHMLGVSLTGAGQYKLADTYLEEAGIHAPISAMGAILRDRARCIYLSGDTFSALGKIDESLNYIPRQNLAERGASYGIRARIQLARRFTHLALEGFGLADSLLQRGDNRRFELENLLDYLEALLDNGEWQFARRHIRRAMLLNLGYGNDSLGGRLTRIRMGIYVIIGDELSENPDGTRDMLR